MKPRSGHLIFCLLCLSVTVVAGLMTGPVFAQEITDLGESVILPDRHYKLDESTGKIVLEARGNGPDGLMATELSRLADEGLRGGAIRFGGESVVVIPDPLGRLGEELEFVEGRFRDQAGFNAMSYKRGDKAPFTLQVRVANCQDDGFFAARLLTPPAHDHDTHWRAERTGDYSALSESWSIEFQRRGEYAEFQIPKLNPYALLVLEAKEGS